MSGKMLGAPIGAIIGGVVGSLIPPYGTWTYTGIVVGATAARLPVDWLATPQPTPPGMSGLLRPLLGLPFHLGAHDPNSGFLDCGGLVAYVLKHGLGVNLPFLGPFSMDVRVVRRTLPPVWRYRGRDAAGWLPLLQPWDVLVWYDAQAESALRGAFDPQMLGPIGALCHLAVAINHETLVSSDLLQGVAFWEARRLAAVCGPDVGALLRVPGIGPWEAVRQPTPLAPGNPFACAAPVKLW